MPVTQDVGLIFVTISYAIKVSGHVHGPLFVIGAAVTLLENVHMKSNSVASIVSFH